MVEYSKLIQSVSKFIKPINAKKFNLVFIFGVYGILFFYFKPYNDFYFERFNLTKKNKTKQN